LNLLAIFAHPDDESYGPAGTLAKYAAEGHQVGLITLTRGEAGSLGISKTLEPEELGHKRSQELRCAAEKLGISYLKIYDLPDKNLMSISDEEGQQIIISEVQNFKPDAIITFHKNGISGHPDHKRVTHWVLQAVEQFAISPSLFCFGILPEHVKMIPQRELFAITEGEVTHIIDVSQYINVKKEAIACHSTQQELWKMFQDLPVSFEQLNQREHFIQVQPSISKTYPTNDLFK
jgi:LmbE family N-acetylglucosaminyl deacetylase